MTTTKKTASKTTTAPAKERRDAQTPTTTRYEPNDGFVRTALHVTSSAVGSVDVLDKSGAFMVRINVFVTEDGTTMVDVIDTEEQFTERRALTFSRNERRHIEVPPGGNLVAAHFAKKKG
jgi:hypothetical protein